MREIDDRYPEFAKPYEPVKRGKRHGGLAWSFFTAACVFVLAVFLLNLPAKVTPGPQKPEDTAEIREPMSVSITINVGSEEKVYSGSEYEITPGFTFTAIDEDGNAADKVSVELRKGTVIKATDVGEYPFGLNESSFDINAGEYDDYTVEVHDGKLTITPADITVAIRGHTLSAVYDGRSHSAVGYDVNAGGSGYSMSDISFSGSAAADRTSAGITYMGLSAEQFTNVSSNYNVTFEVTDGYVQVQRANATVTVTGNKGTAVYDRSTHSVSGYSTVISNSNYTDALFTFAGNAAASRTDAGTSYMGLRSSQFRNLDDNFNVTFVVDDGYVQVQRADVTVTVTGNEGTAVYDGSAHSVSGYSTVISNSNYTDSLFTFTGNAVASRTDAGTAYMGLRSSQFRNLDDNFNVTFVVDDGYVQVQRADVTVTVTGNEGTAVYDGSAHSVSGYSTVISNSSYTDALFTFTGNAVASRTDIGTTYMGLESSQFRNLDDNFNVNFSVTDGYITITEPETDPDIPVIEILEVQDNYNMDMVKFAGIFAKVMPNKASEVGGGLTAKVYVKNDSGEFEADDEYPYEYTGDGNNTEIEIDVIHRMPETMELARETGKLVIEYTYPDGTTGTWESGEFYMYKGSFANLDYSYGDWGVLVSDHKIEVDMIFEPEVEFENGGSMTVTPENVSIVMAEAYAAVFDGDYNYVEDMSFSKDMPDETEFYTGTDGKLHWHFTYNFPDNVVPPAPYTVYSGFTAEFLDPASGWNAAVGW